MFENLTSVFPTRPNYLLIVWTQHFSGQLTIFSYISNIPRITLGCRTTNRHHCWNTSDQLNTLVYLNGLLVTYNIAYIGLSILINELTWSINLWDDHQTCKIKTNEMACWFKVQIQIIIGICMTLIHLTWFFFDN